jgi:hypothetical protein
MQKAVLLGEIVAKRHFDLDDAVLDLGQFGTDGLHDVLAPKAAGHAFPKILVRPLIHAVFPFADAKVPIRRSNSKRIFDACPRS